MRLLFHRKVLPPGLASGTRCPPEQHASRRKGAPLHFVARAGAALAAFCLVVAPASSARADEPPALRHDLRLDIPLTIAATGGAIALGFAAPSTCRACGTNGLDDAARDTFGRNDPGPARALGDASLVVTPLATAGLLTLASHDEGHVENAPLDALLVGEATAIAMLASTTLKVTVGRERPEVRARAPEDRAALATPSDNTSFVSGYSTFTTALATAAGTIAHHRRYRLEPVVWAVGIPLALATAYLDLASDRAHLTDVLGGMALGALTGALVPTLFHGPISEKIHLSATPIQGGHLLTLTLPTPF